MLRLTRRIGQSITIQGDDDKRDIFIRVAEIGTREVAIEIDAPKDLDIWRTELLRRIEAQEREEDANRSETNGRA